MFNLAVKPVTPSATDADKQLLAEISGLKKQLEIVHTAHTTSLTDLAYAYQEIQRLHREVDYFRGEADRMSSAHQELLLIKNREAEAEANLKAFALMEQLLSLK
jgi:hypothetical protein